MRTIELSQRLWSLKGCLRPICFSLWFTISYTKLKYASFILITIAFYFWNIILVIRLFSYNSFNIKRNNLFFFGGRLNFLLFTCFHLLHHYFIIDRFYPFYEEFRVKYFCDFIIWLEGREFPNWFEEVIIFWLVVFLCIYKNSFRRCDHKTKRWCSLAFWHYNN